MAVSKDALAPRAPRRVFAAHPSGVTVVAGLVNGLPVGLAASSFVPVSLDPPLVSVCVARTSTTWPALRDAPAIGVSVLGAHQEDIGRRVGARIGDRSRASPGGQPPTAPCCWTAPSPRSDARSTRSAPSGRRRR
jgi:flavin reductase (DIM6/NTAB) family NADH-FMN oxidoreductase RutF